MPDVLLGFDGSPRKLGIGIALDAGGQAVWCGREALDGSPEGTKRAMAFLSSRLDGDRLTPTLAYIEEPFTMGAGRAFKAGVALGYVEYALRDTWPWITVVRRDPNYWRSRVGIKTGRKHREDLKAQAMSRARELGWSPGNDDAAEGALLAYCAWRDLESGAAKRVA